MSSENMNSQCSSNYIQNLVHYRQRFNWDCGVSCVLMLLSEEQRAQFLDNFDDLCKEEGFGQSTWTIDLCYLLKRFNIKHCMYTTMLGVNEDYRWHGYYDRIINIDRERITRRFKEAPSAGLRVVEGSVSCEEIETHLARHGPVVALVDAGLLACDLCKHNKLKVEFRRCFGGGYKGHYVVLVGRARDKIVYRDPALSPRLCAAARARLSAARQAAGTDDDLVFVYHRYT